MKKTKKNMLFAGLIVVLLVILDQITKVLAVLYLKGQKAIPIIKDVFELHYLENKSAAFGMDPVSLLHKIFHFKKFDFDVTEIGFEYDHDKIPLSCICNKKIKNRQIIASAA